MKSSRGVQQDRQRRLTEIASTQAGYFSAKQAASAGYSSRLQHHHAAAGNWRRIERGIYRLPVWPDSPYEGFVRATLWSLGRGVVSHDSALAYYNVSDVMPEAIHLTVPIGFRKRRPDIVLHREKLRDSDARPSGGFNVTTPLRTIADAARSNLSPEHLEAAVRDAVRLGLVSRRALPELALDLPQEAALRLRGALKTAGVTD